ncbi:MAG: DUF6851 domain-containing protein [Pseudomonadota bacterium]
MSDNISIGTPLGVSLEELCSLLSDITDGLPTQGSFIGTSAADTQIITTPIATIDMRGGNDVLTVDTDTRDVRTRSGDDEVTLNGDAETVRLGSGNDTLEANGSVDFVRSGSGDDHIFVDGLAGTIRAGSGNDTVVLTNGAKEVRLGQGDDTLEIGDLVGFTNGGAGFDTLIFNFNAGDFDVTLQGNKVIFADRFTGEEMVTKNYEEFQFLDRSFSIEEIQENFDPDAVPYIQVGGGTQVVTVNDTDPGVSVIWDRVVQQAVIDTDTPVGPTIASRAYAMMHTAMYDAWSSFDETAVRVSFDETGNNQTLTDALTSLGDDAKTKAMSFAAITVLRSLFPDVEDLYVKVMEERFGFDPDDTTSPEAALGIDAANDLLALRGLDGSNQDGGYTGDFTPTNSGPLDINDITAWTPENVPLDPEEGNNGRQSFLTPQWEDVESFAIDENPDGTTNFENVRPVAPQGFFTEAFEGAVLNFDEQTITFEGSTFAVDKSLIGTVINQGFIDQALRVIDASANLTDEEKIIAEFWEDGGGTAFPPGTWMTFGQFVSARDDNSVDQDAQLFFALGNAVMDAGIATWEAKVFYDYARPVRAIRDLGELGLIGEFGEDEVTGEFGFVIDAFGGFDEDGFGIGTKTILAENFITFQRPGADPSPPFAEYTSGHSAFSAAGAKVLELFTGSDEFGGFVDFAPDTIQFENGVPENEVTLAWETFSEGADEAGLSRIFGGIHFDEGDVNGRQLGRDVGESAFNLAQKFINGNAEDADRPFFVDDLFA